MDTGPWRPPAPDPPTVKFPQNDQGTFTSFLHFPIYNPLYHHRGVLGNMTFATSQRAYLSQIYVHVLGSFEVPHKLKIMVFVFVGSFGQRLRQLLINTKPRPAMDF